MASSTDRRILALPLISSGNVTSSIVLPLDDPSDNLTKKIDLNQIKEFVLSGGTIENYYTTGSTLINGIAYFDRNDQLSAYTLNLTSLTGDVNTFLTAATYNDLTNTITLTDNVGTIFTMYIDAVSGLTVNGVLSATTISGGTLYGDGSNLTGISTQDTFVTGFTYQDNTFVISDNTDSTYNANFNSVTGLTINGNLNVTGETILNVLTANTMSGTTIIVDTITANDYTNLGFPDDETIEAVGDIVRIKDVVAAPTGGTRTFHGNIVVTSGLTANTISATTYYNLPKDVFVTGGTYSDGTTTFTNNIGGTFNVTGFYTGSTDVFVTGGTFSSSTITFTNNSGGTFSVSGISSGTDLSKTLFVDPNGNDSTAVKGDLHKPYQNIYAAKSAATSGDTIYVLPGTWTYDNTNSAGNPYNGQIDTLVNLWKDGVSYYFTIGSVIKFYNQTVTGEDMYLFKSLGSGGTCVVRGDLVFSGGSTGVDTSNGHTFFFNYGIGDSYTFDCEIKTIINSCHCFERSTVTITGQTSTVKITGEDIIYYGNYPFPNDGQTGSGYPIDCRFNPNYNVNLEFNFNTVKNLYYGGSIRMWTVSSASTLTFNIDNLMNYGSNQTIRVEQSGSPFMTIKSKKITFGNSALITNQNTPTMKFVCYGDWYEIGDGSAVNKFIFYQSSQGTLVFNGDFVFYYNKILFDNQTLEKVYINGNVLINSSNFTNVVLLNRGNGEINFNGEITGNMKGVIAIPRLGRININNSNIFPSVTGGTFIYNDTSSTGTTVISNSSVFFNTTSNLINGQYLKNYFFNSKIKNLSSGNLFVNTTSTGSLQIHNSTLQSVSGSTINITGSAPLTISNSTSNTNISSPTLNGSVTILTELDLL